MSVFEKDAHLCKKDGTANNHLLLYWSKWFFYFLTLFKFFLEEEKMKTKNMVMAAVLLAIGTVLHLICPPIFGITPDFLLATMFVSITFNKNVKGTLAIGAAAGILTALITKFPGGQIPSLFDKTISALCFLAMLKALGAGKKDPSLIQVSCLTFINTIISGLVFLYVGLLLATLSSNTDALNIFSSGMGKLIIVVVVPAALANLVFASFMYKLVFVTVRERIRS